MSLATPIVPVPESHPLYPVDTLSASAERRRELLLIEEEIVGAALLAGWRKPRRRVRSRGHSIYIELRLKVKHRVTVRISDHAASRPIGGPLDDWPLIVVTAGVPGAVSHCIAWLEREAVAVLADAPLAFNTEGGGV